MVLSLRLDLIGGFFALRFHSFFWAPETISLASTWATVDKLTPCTSQLGGCAVLASGSLHYLDALDTMLGTHDGPFAYSIDIDFSLTPMRDTLRLCRSVAGHKSRDGYDVCTLHTIGHMAGPRTHVT